MRQGYNAMRDLKWNTVFLRTWTRPAGDFSCGGTLHSLGLLCQGTHVRAMRLPVAPRQRFFVIPYIYRSYPRLS